MLNRKTIGIDVGGTNLRLGVFEGHQLIEELRFEANFSAICHAHPADEAWQKILTVMAESIDSVIKQYPTIQTVGIGFPGFIEPITNNIESSPNLPGLKDVNLSNDLTVVLNETMGLQCKVVVANDANAAAFGEYCLAGKPAGGLIYSGLGTGVGGGLILNGKPYAGQHGCAMEIGHIIVQPNGRACGCGNQGCMEQYASASAVKNSYFEATQKQHSAAEIATFAAAGDEHAIAAYDVAAQSLAQALASIIKVIDVNNIIIGGGMAGAWHLMEAPFNARLNQDLMPVLRGKVNVTTSNAHDVAGMLGAAMLAT